MFSKKTLILALKICTFLIFIGRGYQYLYFDAPFRTLLWDESLLKPLIEGVFNVSWGDYVTNLNVDKWIQRSITFNGILFVLAAFSSLLINQKNKKFLKPIIFTGGIFLIILSILSMKDKFFHYGQFFEHAIQFGVPFILLVTLKPNVSFKKISLYLKILIAVTFTAHALYALGYYPIPGYFIDMTIRSLHVTEDTSVLILHIAGILDIVLSIFIFVPKVSKYFLLYAFFWGTVTALARIVGNINLDFIGESLHQTTYQMIYRLPHGLIPLIVFFMAKELKVQQEKNNIQNALNS